MIDDSGFDADESSRYILTPRPADGHVPRAWIRHHGVHQSQLLTAPAAAG